MMYISAKGFPHRYTTLNTIFIGYNNAALFFFSRKGEITYTPRLIAFDLKGSLGSFSNQEDVSETAEAPLLWQGISEIQKTEPEVKNPFLQHIENANGCMYSQHFLDNL